MIEVRRKEKFHTFLIESIAFLLLESRFGWCEFYPRSGTREKSIPAPRSLFKTKLKGLAPSGKGTHSQRKKIKKNFTRKPWRSFR